MQFPPGAVPPGSASQGQNAFYQPPQMGYAPGVGQAGVQYGAATPLDPAIAQQYAQYYQYMMYYQQMQQMQMLQQQAQQQKLYNPQQPQQQAWGLPQPNDQGLYVLFVYHLPQNVTEDMLNAMFSKHGEVAEIVIMRDDNADLASRTKGYGFVKYRTYHEAAAAVQSLNGAQLENKRLEVSFKLGKGQKRN